MKLATLCYIRDKDSYLMLHRTKKEGDIFKDFWNGIGGKMESNESPEECVIREVNEETGLQLIEPQLKGIITFPNNRDTGETWYVFVFLANQFTGSLKDSEEGDLEWVPLERVSELNIQNADKHFMSWLEKDKIFSAKFYYIGDELKDFKVVFY